MMGAVLYRSVSLEQFALCVGSSRPGLAWPGLASPSLAWQAALALHTTQSIHRAVAAAARGTEMETTQITPGMKQCLVVTS
jgi:hypothetical protein